MTAAWNYAGRILFWASWPALYIYLRIGARTRVVLIADNQILLEIGWLSDGHWMLPGGGLHRGEDPVAGACRETYEECGLRLDPAQLKLLGSERFRSTGFTSFLHFFAAEIEMPLAPIRQRSEIAQARWFPLADVPFIGCKPEVARALQLLGR